MAEREKTVFSHGFAHFCDVLFKNSDEMHPVFMGAGGASVASLLTQAVRPAREDARPARRSHIGRLGDFRRPFRARPRRRKSFVAHPIFNTKQMKETKKHQAT